MHLQLKSSDSVNRFTQKDKSMFIYKFRKICKYLGNNKQPYTDIAKCLLQENNSHASSEFFNK